MFDIFMPDVSNLFSCFIDNKQQLKSTQNACAAF